MKIDHIDILKSDTQGFDLEVLKGAQGVIGHGRVHLILIEINFAALYCGQPRFDEIYAWLSDRGFRLVSFYNACYMNHRIGWCDALFVNPNYESARGGSSAKALLPDQLLGLPSIR
jgi:hypothetical protein